VSSCTSGDFGDCVTGFFLFRRYYLGNRANAALRAEEHNEELLGPHVRALSAEIQAARTTLRGPQ
jgi:hypothetical protein